MTSSRETAPADCCRAVEIDAPGPIDSTDAATASETAILPLGIRNNEITTSDFDTLAKKTQGMMDQPPPVPPRKIREGKRAKRT